MQGLEPGHTRKRPVQPRRIAGKAGRICGSHCTSAAGLGQTRTHAAALLVVIDTSIMLRDPKSHWRTPAAMSKVGTVLSRVSPLQLHNADEAQRFGPQFLVDGITFICLTFSTFSFLIEVNYICNSLQSPNFHDH